MRFRFSFTANSTANSNTVFRSAFILYSSILRQILLTRYSITRRNEIPNSETDVEGDDFRVAPVVAILKGHLFLMFLVPSPLKTKEIRRKL